MVLSLLVNIVLNGCVLEMTTKEEIYKIEEMLEELKLRVIERSVLELYLDSLYEMEFERRVE